MSSRGDTYVIRKQVRDCSCTLTHHNKELLKQMCWPAYDLILVRVLCPFSLQKMLQTFWKWLMLVQHSKNSLGCACTEPQDMCSYIEVGLGH